MADIAHLRFQSENAVNAFGVVDDDDEKYFSNSHEIPQVRLVVGV